MQETLTIARPYAAAAFEHAQNNSDVDDWSEMLNALALAVNDENLAVFIGHPKVSDEQMLELLASVLGEHINPARQNFLNALLAAERLEIAPQISQLFERFKSDAAGRVTVEVTAAHPLSSAEQEKIKTAVKARLSRDCLVEADVDPALIGGAVIKIGDSVTDLSLRGRLNALEHQLG